ncbi:MAG: hypothetical protein RR587_15150 [Solibacillus sp.]
MSGRKKGILIVLGCVTLLGLFYYFVFSSSAVLKNVSHSRGYNVHVSENTIPVEMFIAPEMYDIEMGSEKVLNEVMYDEHHTKIILEWVHLDEDELSFSFTTDHDLPLLEGNFLYSGILHPGGSITRNSGHSNYEAKTPNNETLQIGQTGSGPNSDFGFALRQPPMELLQEGFTVRYYGMYLHEYRLEWK